MAPTRPGPHYTAYSAGRPARSRVIPYSDALTGTGIVWTEENFDRLFDEGPDLFTPGSKMPLQRMPDPRDRAELIAYLKRITDPDRRD